MSNSTLTLTLMAGLPGVGKTILASALGKELDWKVIYKDRLKDQLLLLRDKLDDDVASRIAYDRSFELARKELEDNRSVILDTAALHPFILNWARSITTELNARLKVLFLVVENRDLRTKRIQQRPPQTTVIRFDPSIMDDYLDRYTHLPMPPRTFYLDTSERQLEEYLPDAWYYLISDDEEYADDKKKLESKCKAVAAM